MLAATILAFGTAGCAATPKHWSDPCPPCSYKRLSDAVPTPEHGHGNLEVNLRVVGWIVDFIALVPVPWKALPAEYAILARIQEGEDPCSSEDLILGKLDGSGNVRGMIESGTYAVVAAARLGTRIATTGGELWRESYEQPEIQRYFFSRQLLESTVVGVNQGETSSVAVTATATALAPWTLSADECQVHFHDLIAGDRPWLIREMGYARPKRYIVDSEEVTRD